MEMNERCIRALINQANSPQLYMLIADSYLQALVYLWFTWKKLKQFWLI